MVDKLDTVVSSSYLLLGSKTKKPRTRTSFTSYQLAALESRFQAQQYLVGQARREFATQLHLTEAQVKVWLQNRRIRYRREQRQLAAQTK